jgi:hypothetical protein
MLEKFFDGQTDVAGDLTKKDEGEASSWMAWHGGASTDRCRDTSQ